MTDNDTRWRDGYDVTSGIQDRIPTFGPDGRHFSDEYIAAMGGPIVARTEDDDEAGQISVRVELLNDDGDRLVVFGYGDTADEAVAAAEAKACEQTGDDSYVMNDWGAA